MRRILPYLLMICVFALVWASPATSLAEQTAAGTKKQTATGTKKQTATGTKKQTATGTKKQTAKKQKANERKRKQKANERKRKQKANERKRKQKANVRKRKANIRKRKRRAKKSRKRRRPNSPEGWTWPPTKAMLAQGERCHEEITRLGLDWKKTKRRRNIATPVIVRSMNFGGLKIEPKFRKPPFVMDCHLAKSLAEAGPALVAMGVRALRFSSIHSYRKVRTNGKTKSMLSRHAYGLAVDIYEVDTSEGERLIVKEDYVVADEGNIDIPDRGAQLLRQLERESNASGQFRLLLTPANDPRSHYDHFHYEALVGSIEGSQGKKGRKRRKREKALKQAKPKKRQVQGKRKPMRPRQALRPSQPTGATTEP